MKDRPHRARQRRLDLPLLIAHLQVFSELPTCGQTYTLGMLTFRNSFPTPLSLGKVSFNGFIKAFWHAHKEWHGASVSQWAESVMKMSENRALDDGAPAIQPRPGPRRAHYHSAGSGRGTSFRNGCKGRGILLCFKFMLPHLPPFQETTKARQREEAWSNGWNTRLESGDLASRVTLQLTHWQALQSFLPCYGPQCLHC